MSFDIAMTVGSDVLMFSAEFGTSILHSIPHWRNLTDLYLYEIYHQLLCSSICKLIYLLALLAHNKFYEMREPVDEQDYVIIGN